MFTFVEDITAAIYDVVLHTASHILAESNFTLFLGHSERNNKNNTCLSKALEELSSTTEILINLDIKKPEDSNNPQ